MSSRGKQISRKHTSENQIKEKQISKKQPKKKQKGKNPNRLRLVSYFWIIVGIAGAFGPIVWIIKGILRGIEWNEKLSSDNTKIVKAVVINETNYVINRHINKRDIYSYEFKVNGKTYKGSTESTDFKIGDSVNVKYYLGDPGFNEIVKQP